MRLKLLSENPTALELAASSKNMANSLLDLAIQTGNVAFAKTVIDFALEKEENRSELWESSLFGRALKSGFSSSIDFILGITKVSIKDRERLARTKTYDPPSFLFLHSNPSPESAMFLASKELDFSQVKSVGIGGRRDRNADLNALQAMLIRDTERDENLKEKDKEKIKTAIKSWVSVMNIDERSKSSTPTALFLALSKRKFFWASTLLDYGASPISSCSWEGEKQTPFEIVFNQRLSFQKKIEFNDILDRMARLLSQKDCQKIIERARKTSESKALTLETFFLELNKSSLPIPPRKAL